MKTVGTVARISIFTFCAVCSAVSLQAQTLSGTVKDGSTGAPIAEASVVLMDEDGRIQRGILTESDGSYQLQVPDDGSYTLRVGATSYAVQDTPRFNVKTGEDARVDVLLFAEDRESGAPSGFTQRMSRGEGMFITAEQIRERPGNLFTDIFRFTPVVRVVPLPASDRMSTATSVHADPTVFARRSDRTGGSEQSMTLRIKIGGGVVGAVQEGEPARDCVPVLWVDGIWWGGIDDASEWGPDGALNPGDVEAIEVYNHTSILPDQFDTGKETLCGVIVVWRKQPEEN